jgi:hypothetical protein
VAGAYDPGPEGPRRLLDRGHAKIILEIDVREVRTFIWSCEGEGFRENNESGPFAVGESASVAQSTNRKDAGHTRAFRETPYTEYFGRVEAIGPQFDDVNFPSIPVKDGEISGEGAAR